MTRKEMVINQSKKNQTGKTMQKRILHSWWKKALNEFEKSNLTAKAFCTQNNLPESSFYKWRKIFKSEEEIPLTHRSHFIPLQLEPLDTSSQQKAKDGLHSPESFIGQGYIPSENSSFFSNTILSAEQTSSLEPEQVNNIASSGLSLFLNESLKVSIDKEFHEPTLLRLVQLFTPKRPLTC